MTEAFNVVYRRLKRHVTWPGGILERPRMSGWKLGSMVMGYKLYPIVSMYGIFGRIHHKNEPNVGIYTIHGSHLS